MYGDVYTNTVKGRYIEGKAADVTGRTCEITDLATKY